VTTSELFPQARFGLNGDLLFPRRGDPPKAINGYIRDKGDEYVFHPVVKNCKHRNSIWTKVCGGMVQKHHCNHFNINICFLDCSNCQERVE
jgi:hypothetical protein